MIEIKNVSHSLGGKPILNNINLIVPEGTITGLVGINGAGKTTLLRLLSGIYVPDEGEILCDGKSTSDENARINMFFLPDDPYYTIHTTGKKLFNMYRVFYPKTDYSIFAELIKRFRLNESVPLRNFSKGMRRQLYIALALAVKPKYLLLDEAFDGLDPLSRFEFKKAIIEYVEQNDTAVMISGHSLREMEDFCDSYALLDKMSISSSGDISQKLDKFCKFQLAFATEIADNAFSSLPVISMERNGRFVKIVLEGDGEEIYEKLCAMKPAVIEELQMDFEEVFIQEVEHRGYLK